MFKHFLDNDLIYSTQSGFKTGDSCINQFIVITHDFFKGFEDGLEEAFFLTSLKLLTMHGMRDLSINYVEMEFVGKSVKSILWKAIKNIKAVLQDFSKHFLGVSAWVSIPVYWDQCATGYVTDRKCLHSSTTVLTTDLLA